MMRTKMNIIVVVIEVQSRSTYKNTVNGLVEQQQAGAVVLMNAFVLLAAVDSRPNELYKLVHQQPII